MPVRVVTDSTADIPAELAARLHITVVPLRVHFGDESFRDGVDISTDEFYARLGSAKALPTTSQPPAGDFEEVYRRLAEETTDIVSIHISAKLSGTLSAANAARAAIPECTIELIDSRSASYGVGMVAVKAAEAAAAGASLAEVVDVARQTLESSEIIFTVDTLEYLRRGGRLGRGAALLGTILSIKPILGVRDGEIVPIERVRTRQRALDRLVEIVSAEPLLTDIAVVHSTAADDAAELRRRLQERFPDARCSIGRVGPVIGVHAGPGVIGVEIVRGRGAE